MIYSDANQNKQGPLNPSIQNNPESLEEVKRTQTLMRKQMMLEKI